MMIIIANCYQEVLGTLTLLSTILRLITYSIFITIPPFWGRYISLFLTYEETKPKQRLGSLPLVTQLVKFRFRRSGPVFMILPLG